MVGPFGLRPKGTMSARALPLAQALAQRGHTVALVLPPWSYPADSGRASVDGGVRVINVVLPPRWPGLQHVWLVWRLLRTAFALQPDVIHCFKPKAYAGLAALGVWLLRRLRLTRARLVIDSDDWEGYGGWNEIERYSRVEKAFFAWQERWGLRHAPRLTLASRALQTLAWGLGVPPGRVYYIPNGTAALTPPAMPEAGAPEAGYLLLYTRFFEFETERAAQIVQGVLQQRPAARLVVVGAGLFGEEHTFLSLLAERGLAGRVLHVGWRPLEELPAYFAGAAVAIYPFDDTLVNRTKCAAKLIDLLAAGVPVVADRVGQNAEYIVHEESGLLVTPEQTAQFVASVLRLLDDPALARRLGENARRRMSKEFAWSDLAARVEEAYL